MVKITLTTLLAIHSHIYSFALRFLFLQTRATSISTVKLLYTAKEKRGKPVRKPYPLSYVLRNSDRNLTSENSQDFIRNLNKIKFYVHKFGFRSSLYLKDGKLGQGHCAEECFAGKYTYILYCTVVTCLNLYRSEMTCGIKAQYQKEAFGELKQRNCLYLTNFYIKGPLSTIIKRYIG